jgi:hypothetical protein
MVATELITAFKGVIYLIIVCVVGYGVMLIDKKFLNPVEEESPVLYKEPNDMIVTEEEQKIWEEYESKYGNE